MRDLSGFGELKRLEGAWGTWVGLEDLRGLRSLRGREGLGLDLVEMLMFGWDFKVNAYLRFWNCNTYVQDLWTVNCDLVIWTQPSSPLCVAMFCFINFVWCRGFVFWLRLDFEFCMNWGKRTWNVHRGIDNSNQSWFFLNFSLKRKKYPWKRNTEIIGKSN